MNQFYAVSDNYFTILEKIPRFVTYEKMLYLAKKNFLNHTKDRYYVIPKTVIFHREIVIFPLKICCITLVCKFSAHLLLWAWYLKSQLFFFKCKPVTKIKYQINVCILFIKTQILTCNRWADNGNCNCNRNEKNKCKPLQTKKEPYLPK